MSAYHLQQSHAMLKMCWMFAVIDGLQSSITYGPMCERVAVSMSRAGSRCMHAPQIIAGRVVRLLEACLGASGFCFAALGLGLEA